MNSFKQNFLIGALLTFLAGAAGAQVYQCGNTYSQTPCGENPKKLAINPSKQSQQPSEHPAAQPQTTQAEKLRQQIRTSQNKRRLHDLENYLIPNLKRKIAADSEKCNQAISELESSKIYYMKNVAILNARKMHEISQQCQKKADAMTAKLRRLEDEAQGLSLSK
ncbi:DUF4124 domain-containing protein [Vandammella animalimorsus]|uniref:DUF4124 domain-containing protein n=1 Tax=Vandammella animalimorsus TaxID=2029117 RepID=UPI00117F45D4|nr:DUF4124 domain-containing protein [Vandammella animalimorsus]